MASDNSYYATHKLQNKLKTYEKQYCKKKIPKPVIYSNAAFSIDNPNTDNFLIGMREARERA